MRQDRRAAPKAPINENITAREVRLIGADGQQIGVVSIDEALRAADEAKLDLVEISADAVPPVCRKRSMMRLLATPAAALVAAMVAYR